MPRLATPLLALVVLAAACGDPARPTVPTADAPAAAKAKPTAARYQLRFLAGDGLSIVSDPFPAGGIAMNAADPWKSVAAVGTVHLVNLTREDGSTWAGGTWRTGSCRVNGPADIDNWMTGWDVTGSSDPNAGGAPYTMAGSWLASVALNRDQRSGNYNFYLNDPTTRVGGGGWIRNLASNANAVTTEQDPTGGGAWFEIHYRNAGMGFGSRSSPDGVITLDALPGYEIACASFTLRAERMPD